MTSPNGKQATVELVGWRNRRGQFDKAARSGLGSLSLRMFELLMELRDAAIEESPVGTGPLRGRKRFRDSFKVETKRTSNSAEGKLWNAAKHADFVIFPTRPHIIEPRNKKALHWKGMNYNVPQAGRRGGVKRQAKFLHIFARRVHHPGTKGNDVLGRVWQKNEDRVNEALAAAVDDIRENIVNVFRDRPVKEFDFGHAAEG